MSDSPTFEIDLLRAEGLLHELATKLVRVPLGPRTREVHLRALALKRQLTDWRIMKLSSAPLREVIEELLTLQKKATDSVRNPSGRVLVCGGYPVRWKVA